MKLSFSISSKSSSTTRPPASSNPPQYFDAAGDSHPSHGRGGAADGDASKPQFVTVFDPSESLASDAPAKRVIAPIPNADLWSHKKMKNLPLPAVDDPPPDSRFVLDNSVNGSADANHYGLMLRSYGAEVKSEPPEEDLTKRRFQEDTKDLPDEELPDIPVEGFGAAILAGYGWSEGKGIGRKSKEDAKVFEYKRRAGTEGFGYVQQAAPNSKSSSVKRSQREEIAAGFASVNGKNGADNAGRDERKAESRDRESGREEKRSKNSGREESTREMKSGKDEDIKPAEETNGRRSDYGEKRPVRWLRSHIRVRVISKKFRGGKLYLKKGEVLDVVGPTTCDITMDGSNELVQGVDQEILETALPKRGGSVLVLYGKHKGVFGSLVERDSEKETGLVRDADSHALINVRLEQIAEYVRDPSYLGY